MSILSEPRTERPQRRPTTGWCRHRSPLLTEQVEGGIVCECLLCRAVGPVRESSEEARRALLDIGAYR